MARAKGQTKPGNQKERVAELLADGLEPWFIAERIGCSRKSVSARFAEIRRELGWQAV